MGFGGLVKADRGEEMLILLLEKYGREENGWAALAKPVNECTVTTVTVTVTTGKWLHSFCWRRDMSSWPKQSPTPLSDKDRACMYSQHEAFSSSRWLAGAPTVLAETSAVPGLAMLGAERSQALLAIVESVCRYQMRC